MNGSTLTLGLVAGLAVLGAARRGSRSIPSSPSSPLDLPPFVGLDAPAGFYYRSKPSSVILLGQANLGGGDGPGPIHKICRWGFRRNPNDTFRSPLVNFDNMHHMGGYSWYDMKFIGNQYEPFLASRSLLQRVIDGQKPAAVVNVAGNLDFFFGGRDKESHAKHEEAKQLHAHAKRAGLIVGELKDRKKEDTSYVFTVARPGTYGENFDLDAWTRSYAGYGSKHNAAWWYDRANTARSNIKDVPLWESIGSDGNVDNLPSGPMQTGLLLGFPICTTVSFLTGNGGWY